MKFPVIRVIRAIKGWSKAQAAGEVAVNNTHAGAQVFFLLKRLFIIYKEIFGHEAHNRLTVEASDGSSFSHTYTDVSTLSRRERYSSSSTCEYVHTILHNHRKRA